MRIEREKEGISLMFLAADQLRSQGYPGFANSHGKGGVLRAEGGGAPRARGGRDGCPFFSAREGNALGEGNPRALLSDKVGLGPGRRRKNGSGASQGILADSSALFQVSAAKLRDLMNSLSSH